MILDIALAAGIFLLTSGLAVSIALWAGRRELKRAEIRILEEFVEQLEARKAEQRAAEENLRAYLEKFKVQTKEDLQVMAMLVADFEEMLSPYEVSGDGSEN